MFQAQLMGRRFRRRIAGAMALAMLLGCLGGWPFVQPAAAATGWPASVLDGTNMPFGPSDGLVTTQNPPDFHWPAVPGADGYDLQVSRSSSVADVVYENDALTVNYYNFPHAFDAGTWYWRVKYHKPADGWSEWSDVRRFRIEEQNMPFPVPPIEDIIEQVTTGHPRIWTTDDTLDEFQDLKTGIGKETYDKKLVTVEANIPLSPPAQPDFPFDSSHPRDTAYIEALSKFRAESDAIVSKMLDAAFIYLVTGRADAGADAKERLLSIASWDPDGDTSYVINDQVHRYIALKSATAYDWIYDLLSETERQTVRNMIVERTNTMVSDLIDTHTIWKNPYDSHGWTAFGYMGVIATALLHDEPAAEQWFRQIVPAFINLLPPWGGEDGGWSQGTGYWQWSSLFSKEFMDVLLSAGGFNLYDKAYSRNEGLYPLYAFPHSSPGGVFGDGSEDYPGYPSVTILNRLSQIYGDSRLKWEAEAIGSPIGDELANYFYGDDDLGEMPPVDLPDAKWFEDIGVVAMHSELYDPKRVSLFFKSSPFGSFNHSHADQNSFVVKAFGESLVIESGFYDEYFTDHDKNYGKQTLASNAITYDGKKGQPINSIDADGKITGFVAHPDFDATSGDASKAYAGVLTQADRSIIYVRPSTFVVVDKLATADPAGAKFEWRLHAEDDLQIDGDQSGATILKGGAGLKVKLYTPSGLTAQPIEDQFIGQDGLAHQPTGKYATEAQKHTAFVTPKTNATTIVSTMEAYERSGAPHTVDAENHGDYIKLTFADESVVYVRLTGTGEIDAGDVQFNGTAAAIKGDTALLVGGTKLTVDGVTVIESDRPATIVYGGDRLSVSGLADMQVAVHAPGTTALRAEETGAEILQGGAVQAAMDQRGVHWAMAGDTLNIRVERGQRAFKLNDAPVPEAMTPVTLETEIDGVPGTVTLERHSDTEGQPVAWGKLSNPSGLYTVEEAPAGFMFARHGKPGSTYLEDNAAILVNGDTSGTLKLSSVGGGGATAANLWNDPDAKRDTFPILWQEAEAFNAFGGKSFLKYTTRAFLSGGTGLGDWSQRGQWAKWTLNVPKAGTYDLVVKYATGDQIAPGVGAGRYAKVGDGAYYFEAPKTVDWGSLPENWKGLRIHTGQQLAAGPVDITMWHEAGGLNLDWIGLVEVRDDETLPSAPGGVQLLSQTAATATIGWTASTDNAGIDSYAVYVNGVQKKTVPAGMLTATVDGLTAGQTYALTVRAIDTSGNRSLASAAVSVTMTDMTPPVWSETAALRAEHAFANAVKLAWDPAIDESGPAASYSVYRQELPGGALTKIASVVGVTYDAIGLQAGGAYAFKVEAKDALGNESEDGPAMTLTLPAANAGGEYYETFDEWTTGPVSTGNGWTITHKAGATTTVETAALADLGGKALKVTDNYNTAADEYGYSPIVLKKTTPLGGKVTFETRFKYSKLTTDFGNFDLNLGGSDIDVARFLTFSDGTFGYWKTEGGTNTAVKFVTDLTLPRDQWITLRFDVDLDAKKYDISMQADAWKSYAGTGAPGTVDKKAGIYRLTGINFYNNAAVSQLNAFVFKPGRFTGVYQFDYATMYKTDAVPAAQAAQVATVRLRDSAGQPLAGGTVSYYDGGWKPFGVTDASGKVSKALPSGNYTFAMSYEGTRQNMAQNTGSDATIVFQTVAAKVRLKDSQGQPLEGGDVSYYADGWRTFGAANGGEARKELLPGNYTFNMTYAGAYQSKAQDIGADPVVVFQTASVKVRLEDSKGDPLDGGAASYYMDGWHSFGTVTGGEASKELLPVNYTFNVSYEGANLSKPQNAGTDANVVFATVNVAVSLKDGQGNPVEGGQISFYASGWRTFGTTDAAGIAHKELLPVTYTFNGTHGGAADSGAFDIADEPEVPL
ncbi:Fibronectin type III domain-containing protein [Cohnella sp. OV330]|uniref:DUF4962 domain-containing protein n=1 Tax=Cohnella sp. OV330 TaxID=1855288 RepID=UPI0008DF5D98|nr:DUF4962 domain-containing protein [Cohnella sp. OV330]SFB56423.1 Fibronectin type III domain-containing protein [Cohnella sp. OV330]